MAFGHYLRRQREERDMSLTELARRVESPSPNCPASSANVTPRQITDIGVGRQNNPPPLWSNGATAAFESSFAWTDAIFARTFRLCCAKAATANASGSASTSRPTTTSAPSRSRPRPTASRRSTRRTRSLDRRNGHLRGPEGHGHGGDQARRVRRPSRTILSWTSRQFNGCQ